MAESKRLAFITGGTGMVGSHLARRLLDQGWQVRALARRTSDTALLGQWGVEIVEGELGDPPSAFAPRLAGVDVVFHCAAMVSDWAPLDDMMAANVTGTRNLAEAALVCPRPPGSAQGKPPRFVYLSSMVVLGMQPQHDLGESAPLIHTGDHYNLTKIRAEELVQQYIRDRGLPGVIIRPPYVYGPRDRQFLPRVLGSLGKGEFRFVGSGRQPITLVYVANLVQALVLAATRPEAVGEVFLITDGEAITRERILEIVCEETGYPMPRQHVPTWLVRMLCPIFEMMHSLRKGLEPPLVNKFRVKFMATPLTYRIDKARRILGYRPEPGTEEGLRQTLAWFRENHPELMPATPRG